MMVCRVGRKLTDYQSVFRELLVKTFGARGGAVEVEVKGLSGQDKVDCEEN